MSLAFSGGTTPAEMFRKLAAIIATSASVAAGWARTHVLQVDERIAPDGDGRRNANDLITALLDPTGVDGTHRHLMPVNQWNASGDVPPDRQLQRPDIAAIYATTLEQVAPRGLDIVVLGLGDDGHTASLVPGDGVLDVLDASVAVTGEYRGSRRLTLTRATLDRAHLVLWLVTGATKAEPLRRLMHNDRSIPAGLLSAPLQVVFADIAAATGIVERPIG